MAGAQLHEVSTWSVKGRIGHTENIFGYGSIAISPGSEMVVLGGRSGEVELLRLPSLELVRPLEPHNGPVTGVAFGNDGSAVLTASYDRTIKRWAVSSGDEEVIVGVQAQRPPEPYKIAYGSSIDVFAISPNKDVFATADISDRIQIRTVQDASIVRTVSGPDPAVLSLEFTPDGGQLLVGGYPGIHIWTIADEGEPIVINSANEHGVSDIAFSPDGSCVAACYMNTDNANGVVEFWDWGSKESLGTVVTHPVGCLSLQFSPDGKHLATTGRRRGEFAIDVHIWDVNVLMEQLYSGVPPRHE